MFFCEEQFYLRSENIPSDHSIGSEFYEAEIEVMWAKASAEKTLLKKRLEFNENVRNNFGLSVAQLDTETLRVAKNIRKLLINTKSVDNVDIDKQMKRNMSLYHTKLHEEMVNL